jgi:hypothetical protein
VSQTLILYPNSFETVWILRVAILATRVLFRDLTVPVLINWWMFKIDLNVHSNTQTIYEIAMNVHKGKSEKSTGGLEGPQKKSRPAGKEVSWNFNRYRDKNGRTYWITASHRLILSPQKNSEPSNTEESDWIENPKAPSVFQTSPGAVQALEIGTVATRIQRLSQDIGAPVSNIAIVAMRSQEVLRDIGVPVSISRRMYDIDQNVYKIEWNKLEKSKNEAVESPQNTLQLVQVEVRWEYTGHYERMKTYCETKTARTSNAERNKYQITKTEVSDDRDKGGAYPEKSQQDKYDHERSRKG